MADTQPEPRIELPDAEYQRLMELLDDSPRPTGYSLGGLQRRRARDITRGREPFFDGPGNLTLVWGEAAYQYQVLKSLTPRYALATPSNTYMALGPGAYYRALGKDRMLAWRQLLQPKQDAPIRLSLFDTRALSPVARKHAVMLRFKPGDMVLWKTGLLAQVDIPIGWSIGAHSLVFPDAFRASGEILLLGLQFGPRRSRARPVVFAARPQEAEVRVATLDWWMRKRRLGVVGRIVRDPVSGNLVADGVGVKPFLMAPTGVFLGWLGVEKPRGGGTGRITGSA